MSSLPSEPQMMSLPPRAWIVCRPAPFTSMKSGPFVPRMFRVDEEITLYPSAGPAHSATGSAGVVGAASATGARPNAARPMPARSVAVRMVVVVVIVPSRSSGGEGVVSLMSPSLRGAWV